MNAFFIEEIISSLLPRNQSIESQFSKMQKELAVRKQMGYEND